ncbi:MAG: RidA family protein [Pedobacter sp.]|jgi:enamine deaminase RidA (YjgF/YER057c/UK114 family)
MKKYSLLFLISAALLSCNPKQDDAAKQDASAPKVNIDDRLKELNIQLVEPSVPTANFVKTVRVGNLVYTSGHGPDRAEGPLTGRVGADLTLEQGQEAARLTGIALLSSLKKEIGDLGKVKRVVKVLGMVQCTPEFKDQPKVMNAFSDMMVAVFGEKGKHARSAVGMAALPGNIAVEIEMIVEVEE